MSRTPSISRILVHDTLANWLLVCSLAPVLLVLIISIWMFGFPASWETMMREINEEFVLPPRLFLGLFILFGVILFVLALLRARVIARIVRDGAIVDGLVKRIYFNHRKGYGTVEFSYEIDSISHHASSAIVKNRDTKAISVGDNVELVVDSQNPDRALIATLYTAD